MQNKKGCGCSANKSTNSNINTDVNLKSNDPGSQGNVGYIPFPVPTHMTKTIHQRPNKVESEKTETNLDSNKQESAPMEFQARTVESAKTLKEQLGKKIGMVQSFANAVTSRGLGNNKINKPIKQLRVLSCFGNKEQGGELPPCEYLKQSTVMPGKHFCGGCGCGDKPHTWLVSQGEEYSKLDYPRLSCPLKMPGFTNYEPSKPEEMGPPPSRRNYIENINYTEVEKIPVTLPVMEKPPPTV